MTHGRSLADPPPIFVVNGPVGASTALPRVARNNVYRRDPMVYVRMLEPWMPGFEAAH